MGVPCRDDRVLQLAIKAAEVDTASLSSYNIDGLYVEAPDPPVMHHPETSAKRTLVNGVGPATASDDDHSSHGMAF
ncbi:hypothetical protein BDW22DRAFT_1432747 [Trametopsis cervina]|nr:hypothetical protein BDW22DRAFT_1432747 [Trametopsis cervina]